MFSMRFEGVLKAFLVRCTVLSRRHGGVSKAFSRRFQRAFNAFRRRLEGVLKAFWRRFEGVLEAFWRRFILDSICNCANQCT